jgi:hypothetical protein
MITMMKYVQVFDEDVKGFEISSLELHVLQNVSEVILIIELEQ